MTGLAFLAVAFACNRLAERLLGDPPFSRWLPASTLTIIGAYFSYFALRSWLS